MKISIIVPIYNIDCYLKKNLESIISQEYPNLEIILVDDGSTDNSYNICLEYQERDKRINIIRQKNQGLSNARNKGLEVATGDFVWFVDGDDYIENNIIEKILPYLDKNDLIVFNYNEIKGKTKTKVDSFYDYDNLDTKYLLSHCNAWNKIIRRTILKNAKFPANRIYEDLFLMPTLILKTKKIKFLDETLYNYVYRKNSIKNTANKTEDKIYALNNLYSKLNSNYSLEVEYLYIYNLLITSLIEEVKNKCKHDFKYLNKVIKEKYPKYYNNQYWSSLGILKRIYLKLIYHNLLFFPRILTYLKIKVFK